jgi:hypothetical protein
LKSEKVTSRSLLVGENSKNSEEVMTSIIWIQHSLEAELEKEVMA